MKKIHHPSAVYLTAVVFVAHSFFSCSSSSEATKELEKYDVYEYADQATFNTPYGKTYRASMASLEDMGFTIAVSDERSGMMQGEQGTRELRPEEDRNVGGSDDAGAGVFAVLVAIVIAVLVIFVGSGNDQSDDAGDHHYESSPRTDHVYVITLNLRSEGRGTTIVMVGASRFDYEDGDEVRSVILENKYLNHGLFDRIEKRLKAVEEPMDE